MAKKFEAVKFDSLFGMEESVLSYWQADKTFQKSLDKNKDSKIFSFYDGPPFITGLPHYGTLLPSIAKDIIPRYQTMKGHFVRRRWGWDVHGLPAENQVEKELGLKVKTDIEKLGVDKFIEACRAYVKEGSEAWRWYIDHIGRWVDIDDAYRTDSLNYMESVMWIFKQLFEKKLVYRGRRTSLYCPRCATPLSKFEVTMDEDSYRDVEDPAVTVAFKIKDVDPSTSLDSARDRSLRAGEVYLLAWTTTPWTLPANLALAVDKTAEYVKVTDGKKTYIMAYEALPRYGDCDFEIVETFKGAKLVGETYEPLYSFLPTNKDLDYKVYEAGFVTMTEGTGIVHVAPGFGEEDSKLGEKVGLSIHETIDDEGHFIAAVKPWAKQYYKKANPSISEDLKKRGLLFKEETITHSYPHCWRCATPLIYKAQVSWYLKIDPLREQLLKQNKKINWVPEHFGSKRFAYNIENAPDWSLSRTRYWGSPVPVWETKDGEIFVPESLAELEKLSGQKITDLHRPAIDEVVLTLPSGKKAHRVKEVLDVWFESGSMPFAQDHFPFGNKEAFERHFPADFIIEYTGQLRGWFYYLHLLANAVRGDNAFKNVVVTGVLAGNDGRKMSKSFGNYPDPKATIEKYGAESLRLYFMGSKIMAGEDPAISEEDIREQSRLLNVLHNSVRYFVTYANVAGFNPETKRPNHHLLDRWIIARLEQALDDYSRGLDMFDFVSSTKQIRPFIEDLSTWYIRRCRDRFVAGDSAAMYTLHYVLKRFALGVAPTLPFSAEFIWRGLGETNSVHLQDYPKIDELLVSDSGDLLDRMSVIRKIASAVHMIRSQEGVSLRQPLATMAISGFDQIAADEDLVTILQDESNVQEIAFTLSSDQMVTAEVDGGTIGLDIALSDELREEGRFRELLRKLQEARKKAGLEVGQKVKLMYFCRDEELSQLLQTRTEQIKTQATFSDVTSIADDSKLTPIDGEELAIRFE